MVPIRKTNGQIQVCVGCWDINKACLKDDLPLPNMDVLIDSTSRQDMLSFMVRFNNYNQIKMLQKNAKKTSSRTLLRNFYYIVMPFGLKNIKVTYQWAMTIIFYYMIGKEVEDYVNNLVVKYNTCDRHRDILEKVFERWCTYNLIDES